MAVKSLHHYVLMYIPIFCAFGFCIYPYLPYAGWGKGKGVR